MIDFINVLLFVYLDMVWHWFKKHTSQINNKLINVKLVEHLESTAREKTEISMNAQSSMLQISFFILSCFFCFCFFKKHFFPKLLVSQWASPGTALKEVVFHPIYILSKTLSSRMNQ